MAFPVHCGVSCALARAHDQSGMLTVGRGPPPAAKVAATPSGDYFAGVGRESAADADAHQRISFRGAAG